MKPALFPPGIALAIILLSTAFGAFPHTSILAHTTNPEILNPCSDPFSGLPMTDRPVHIYIYGSGSESDMTDNVYVPGSRIRSEKTLLKASNTHYSNHRDRLPSGLSGIYDLKRSLG